MAVPRGTSPRSRSSFRWDPRPSHHRNKRIPDRRRAGAPLERHPGPTARRRPHRVGRPTRGWRTPGGRDHLPGCLARSRRRVRTRRPPPVGGQGCRHGPGRCWPDRRRWPGPDPLPTPGGWRARPAPARGRWHPVADRRWSGHGRRSPSQECPSRLIVATSGATSKDPRPAAGVPRGTSGLRWVPRRPPSTAPRPGNSVCEGPLRSCGGLAGTASQNSGWRDWRFQERGYSSGQGSTWVSSM